MCVITGMNEYINAERINPTSFINAWYLFPFVVSKIDSKSVFLRMRLITKSWLVEINVGYTFSLNARFSLSYFWLPGLLLLSIRVLFLLNLHFHSIILNAFYLPSVVVSTSVWLLSDSLLLIGWVYLWLATLTTLTFPNTPCGSLPNKVDCSHQADYQEGAVWTLWSLF